MKVRIHYEISGVEDSYVLNAEFLEDIRWQNKAQMEQRSLDEDKNNMWSEEIG